MPLQLDVTNAAQIATAAATATDLDLLVNNAGIVGFFGGNFTDPKWIEGGRQEMEVNFLGTFAVTQAFAPVLARNGGGASTRRPVRDRDRWIDLRESEVRMLATAGAFRVVVASDLRDHRGRPASASNGELRGLCEAGLVETRPYVIGQDRTTLVTLTDRGRELLERHRRTDREVAPQTYYAGFVKPRELSHDAQLYRAYERSAERLKEKGAIVTRVVLDYELKRDYQRFLHDLKRERREQEQDADRHAADVGEWAASVTRTPHRDTDPRITLLTRPAR